ncbi:phage tail tip lysozyme, partial [Nocardia sp. NPDC023852]|uniref:phage tail tip lysozyme n=1 Tax=Nocardia sp. NPDC023852 TaxID=3154697 RepID=UPI00340EAE16
QSSESTPGGSNPQAKEIYQYLITKYGFTPAQAAGIVGNMQVESGLKTSALNPREGAIGLCQWLGGRRRNLERFAATRGPVTDWKVQVDFMMQELRGSESGAYRYLKAAQTPAAAAAVFDQYYERSSGEARGQRIANANRIAASMGSVSA